MPALPGVTRVSQQERLAIIRQIEEMRGSRVICYLTSDRANASSQVGKDAIPIMYEHLREIGEPKQIDVMVYTAGGDTLAAFGIARLVREFTSRVGALIPDRCYSAGTLFVLGANEIVMTRAATLSPIDPSIVRPLNPVIEISPGQRQLLPLSVESVAGFKALVTEDWMLKGEDALGNALRLLAERVHPLALGDVYRTRQQIELLARKLLGSHRTDEGVGPLVATLTKELGSHDYLISRTEARSMFGAQVAESAPALEGLLWKLYRDFALEMELQTPFDAGQLARGAGSTPRRVVQRLALVESSAGTHIFEKEIDIKEVVIPLTPGLPPNAGGGQRAIQQEIVRSGWTYYESKKGTP